VVAKKKKKVFLQPFDFKKFKSKNYIFGVTSRDDQLKIQKSNLDSPASTQYNPNYFYTKI